MATLWLFVIGDLCYSFVQHFNSMLDGDMPAIVLPTEWYKPVMSDPFGFGPLLEGERYPGTNRFFAHWFESTYYKNVPHALQTFVSPIDSVYLAGAILKTCIQMLLLFLMTAIVTGTKNIRRLEFAIAAALIAPMFQVEGFVQTITLLMHITYTFFYTLPLTLLLLFLFPFYNALVLERKSALRFWQHLLLIVLCVVIPFSGSLSPALVLLVCPGVLLYLFFKTFQSVRELPFDKRIITSLRSIPNSILFYFTLISVLSIYSYYIGTFNSENAEAMPLAERYKLLGQGLWQQLFHNPAFPVLILVTLLNVWILRVSFKQSKQLNMIPWLLLFSVVYVLMLPLGGYRSYRPLIVRGDTFMPVTLCIIYSFAVTSLYALRYLQSNSRVYLASLLLGVVVLFTVVDTFKPDAHRCEKQALQTIAASPDSIVRMETWCSVLEWHKINDPKGSEDCGELLYLWRITKEKKLYTTSK